MSFTCKICGFFDSVSGSYHVGKHGISTREYFLKYVLEATNPPLCCIEGCSGETIFQGLARGYTKTCSTFCSKILIRGKLSELNNDPNSGVGFKNKWKSGRFLTDEERARRSDLAKKMNDSNPKFGYCKHGEEIIQKRISNLKRKHKEDINFQRKIIDNIAGWFEYVSPKAGVLHIRSKYELQACKLFDSNKSIISYSYESVIVPYVGEDGKEHNYIIDFELLWDNGLVEFIEIKPSRHLEDNTNKLKFHFARLYAEVNNAHFTTLTENELYHSALFPL